MNNHSVLLHKLFLFWGGRAVAQREAMASSFLRFLYYTQRRITVGKTPLDGWSARRRDYLTTYSTHKRHVYGPGSIRTHSPSKRLQTHALDRTTTRIRKNIAAYPIIITGWREASEICDVILQSSDVAFVLLRGLEL